MILKEGNTKVILVEVIDKNNGKTKGLLLLPQNTNMVEFEKELKISGDIETFMKNNKMGVQYISSYKIIM